MSEDDGWPRAPIFEVKAGAVRLGQAVRHRLAGTCRRGGFFGSPTPVPTAAKPAPAATPFEGFSREAPSGVEIVDIVNSVKKEAACDGEIGGGLGRRARLHGRGAGKEEPA